MHRFLPIIVYVTISFVAGFLLHDSLTPGTSLPKLAVFTPTPSPITYATVLEVLDGDTIRINTGELVRYQGIDAPEKNGAYGQSATKHNEEYVMGKTVRLEYDYQNQDQYGRILAYIWVDDVLVNEKMIEEGYSTYYTIAKTRKLKYADRLKSAQLWAKEHHNGMWIEELRE